ncbi:MAG: hypothetical protein FWG87_13730, partial [Defluviitaleaceae bacterium]|nr:hypothetical protein [Defluviitaleaceae bacterium]
MDVTRPELTNVRTSGRINPSPTKNLQIPSIRGLTNDLLNADLYGFTQIYADFFGRSGFSGIFVNFTTNESAKSVKIR